VTFNYRTNIFGFPLTNDTSEIPIANGGHNLGLLDQELALTWTRDNIAHFGGDPNQIFIMGQSAGASSATWFLQRHPVNPPFAGAILLSSSFSGVTPNTNETAWTEFATAVGCTQPPGSQRLACLKAVPADTIHTFMNGPNAPSTFTALIDKYVSCLYLMYIVCLAFKFFLVSPSFQILSRGSSIDRSHKSHSFKAIWRMTGVSSA
jgi:carboxylesterase 2